METHDSFKEGIGNGSNGVGVTEGDEMRILGEAIDHHEDDRLAIDLGQVLDKIHRNVSPNLGWHVEGLQ